MQEADQYVSVAGHVAVLFLAHAAQPLAGQLGPTRGRAAIRSRLRQMQVFTALVLADVEWPVRRRYYRQPHVVPTSIISAGFGRQARRHDAHHVVALGPAGYGGGYRTEGPCTTTYLLESWLLSPANPSSARRGQRTPASVILAGSLPAAPELDGRRRESRALAGGRPTPLNSVDSMSRYLCCHRRTKVKDSKRPEGFNLLKKRRASQPLTQGRPTSSISSHRPQLAGKRGPGSASWSGSRSGQAVCL